MTLAERLRTASQRRAVRYVVDPIRPSLRKLGRVLVYGFHSAPWGPMEYPPGHYYSPLPSPRDIAQYRIVAEQFPTDLPAIELRLDDQIATLREMGPFISAQPFGPSDDGSHRYHFDNAFFPGADAILLHAMLRKIQPRRIIEVGSGWSTAAMLDTYEGRDLPEVTLIEPYPERLFERLHDSDRDRVTILEQRLQDTPLEMFASLVSDDVLFIDSTHVLKLGSDVNYLFFQILPRLARGVYIHFHDIFYPFEYPIEWVEAGFGWNETYLLRAFLEFNDSFEIVVWNNLLHTRCSAMLRSDFPELAAHPFALSLWLRRVA